jgi:2-methylcitrate dehydratase PrpD
MVAHGFTGLEDVLNGRGNFMDAFSTRPDRDLLIDGLGSRFEIMLTNIKKWCVGSPIQAVLDSLEHLLTKQRVSHEQVRKVVVHLPPGAIHVVADRGMSDINCPFCVALMLVDGRFTFHDSHDAGRMRDPAVLAMKERVSLVASEELRDATPIRQAIVEIHLEDGQQVSHRTRAVMGVHENPLDRPGIVAKAEDLVAPVLGNDRCRDLIDQVFRLERVADVRAFRSFLQRI